jgi:hypothetical protein
LISADNGPQRVLVVSFSPLMFRENLTMLKRLWSDESGAILSAELLLLMVILVIGLTVGMVALRDAIVAQFGELALSIAQVDTGYGWAGISYAQSLDGGIVDSVAYVPDSQRIPIYAFDGAFSNEDLALVAIEITDAKLDAAP